MTPVPYVLKGFKSDGKFFGTLTYGSEVVSQNESGEKSEKNLESWAREAALDHKASISPRETYKVERTFVL